MKFIKKYMLAIFVAFGISMFIEPAFCMLILGFIVLYSSAETIVFLEKMKRVGIQTLGTVTSYEKDDEGDITAIVEFTAAGGEVIKDEPYIISLADVEDFTPYNEIAGSEVSVLYHPDDPKRFVIKGKKDWEYITSIFGIFVSLAFLTVGIGILMGFIE
jgi:hypothetical protein